jgi:hypothetical protein
MTRRAVLVSLALVACGKRADEAPVNREAVSKLLDQIEIATPPGMSDLTIDERGVIWAIPERDHEVLEIDVTKQPPSIVRHPLHGVLPDVDTEAIAWLGGGKLAFGLEGGDLPIAGIAFAELRGNDVVITSTRSVTSDELGVSLELNMGIEALCGESDELLAVVETPGMSAGKRWEPLVRVRGDSITVAKLWLTTPKGKISALTCSIADDGTASVVAVERHFGVSRLLTFSVGRDATEATPALDLDLWPVLQDKFNMEGIARLPDGRLVLINDNQSRKVSGPTELFILHPR